MATEKRLIDANSMEYALQAICDRESGIPLVLAEWLAGVVSAAPTVDAVEVVHGEWIDMPDLRESLMLPEVYRCSVCGKSAVMKHNFATAADQKWMEALRMREMFDDAFFLLCDALESFLEVGYFILKCIINLTIPLWLIPYMIIVAIEKTEEENGGS